MSTSTQRHSLDTFTSEDKPTTNYASARILRVKSSAKYAYIYFARSFPLGATLMSAKLTVCTMAISGSGDRTLTARRVSDKPYFSRMTWANQPGAKTGPGEPVAVTKSGAQPGGTEWVFDVSGHLQKVADGADWNGWRIETDSTSELSIYGVDYGGEFVATLAVEWSDAPDIPSQLSPSGGRVIDTSLPTLRWDYTDVSGDTEMSGLQVQIGTAEDMSGAWDSGEIDASTPELDLAGTSYDGIPANEARWWSVRVRDGGGLWSGWSDSVRAVHIPKGTLTLLSPQPGGTVAEPVPVTDSTPPVEWALDGQDQDAYRVRVYLNTQPKTPLWDTGRVTSTDTAVTVPEGVIRWDDRLYRVAVDVWDIHDRVTTPGRPAAYTQQTIAYVDWDADVPGVDSITATVLSPRPHVRLTWTRGETPDGWVVVRNDEIIARLTVAETRAEAGYQWMDRGVPSKADLRYTVRPAVNGRMGYGNPAAVVRSEPVGIWLLSAQDEVCIWGRDEGTFEMVESSTIHEPVRSDRVIQIRQGLRGYSGQASGLLLSRLPGLLDITARQWRDALLRIKRDGGARLVIGSLALDVLTSDVVAAESPETEERFIVSFSWWQRDAYDWEGLG